MSQQDEFVGRIRGLVISLSGTLTSGECSEVEHFIDHGEPGEALRSLAWIIVDEGKQIPADAYALIVELSAELIAEEHIPPTLQDHVLKQQP